MNKIEGDCRILNITAGLRKVIYDINPNHLYCPYKSAFEKWATELLNEISDTRSQCQEDSNTAYSASKKTVLCQPALFRYKASAACAKQCTISSKSVLEGWTVCPAYHDSISHMKVDHSLLHQKRTNQLPSIPNYISLSRTKPSQRTKDAVPRYTSNAQKNAKNAFHTPACGGQTADEGEESDYILRKIAPKKHFCRLCNYSFRVTDRAEDNMERYRQEYTYSSLPNNPNNRCLYKFTHNHSPTNNQPMDDTCEATNIHKKPPPTSGFDLFSVQKKPVIKVQDELGNQFYGDVCLPNQKDTKIAPPAICLPNQKDTKIAQPSTTYQPCKSLITAAGILPSIDQVENKPTMKKYPPTLHLSTSIIYMPDIGNILPRKRDSM